MHSDCSHIAKSNTMISPLAHIDPAAKIGKNVTIEPFAYIQADVEIGDGCWIGPHASIMNGAIIGKNCNIHSGAVIAGVPQDLKFRGEKSVAIIGDNTTVRECATINRGTAAQGSTIIGSNCLLMAYVHVGHDCVVGDYVVLVNRVSLAGEVEIGDWAILGGHVAVHQFCRIGDHSMISGGTLISKDVAPFTKVAHNPPSFVGINSIGLRRRGFSADEITLIQDMCRILFQSGMSYSNACDKIETEYPSSDLRNLMIDFVRSSKRGVSKPYQIAMKDVEFD